MTALDLPTWTVADDPDGELTLWYGDTAVLRRCDIGFGAISLATREYRDWLFDLLTRVLAPDEATVERLAGALWYDDYSGDAPIPDDYYDAARIALAALAGTSAQARHTDGDVSASPSPTSRDFKEGES